MSVQRVSAYDRAWMFRPTTKTGRPSPVKNEEVILKVLDATKKSTNSIRRNHIKDT